MSRIVGPMIEPLKISAPYRDFAVDVKAGSMGGTEKSQKCGTFECRALKMGIFRELEDRNVAKNSKREKSCGPG